MNAIELMQTGPVIPVITITEIETAVPLAKALVAGGVRVLEVTLRTPLALDAIRIISNEVEQAIVGVGTITRASEFEAAMSAGARFGVSPGISTELTAAANDTGLPFLPGVMTPSDVITAINAGYQELKLFPAKQAGGIGMLKAMSGPFPQIKFCPTGGIDAITAPDFLALNNVVCVGGSWLTPAQAVAAHDWQSITQLAGQTRALV